MAKQGAFYSYLFLECFSPLAAHEFQTKEGDFDPVVCQGLAVDPPTIVDCVKYLQAVLTCQRDSDEFSVVKIELTETGIIGELNETTAVMDCYGHDAAVELVCLVLPEPLKERVARTWLPGKAESIVLLFDDAPLVVQEQTSVRPNSP